MAATNRVDILDPAILRPGRFDRKVLVGRPDVQGRLEILTVHAKSKPLGDDVDLRQIAQTTAGLQGRTWRICSMRALSMRQAGKNVCYTSGHPPCLCQGRYRS